MKTVEGVLRRTILAAAESSRLQSLVTRHGMRFGAARFVAGTTLDEAVVVLRRLNEAGLRTNTTLLGEGVVEPTQTHDVVGAYCTILNRIASERLQTNIALKLTHLGLALDEELAVRSLEQVVSHAADRNIFVRIDMEESPYVAATLRVFRGLRERGHANVGTALQSCLFRSEADLESLLDLQPNLRFVKGAYLESPEVAYPDKADVDAAYLRLIRRSLEAGGFTAIATHDESLIGAVTAHVQTGEIPRSSFQFQMLYGVKPKLQLELVRRGYDVLIATPYGPDWYRYLMRRLAERPANLLFFARNLLPT